MKMLARLFAVCLMVLPAMASAQLQPPPGMPPPDFAAMKQFHDQMEGVHQKERERVLAALTPAHRTLVANIVGDLAIAENPDPKAAASKLDAALSANEKSAVLQIHNEAMSQMRDLMQKQRTQLAPPPGAPASGDQHVWRMPGESGTPPTAGQVVLRVLGAGPDMHGDMMYIRRDGMYGRKPVPPTISAPVPNPAST